MAGLEFFPVKFTILELKSGLFMAILRPHLITIWAAVAKLSRITNVSEWSFEKKFASKWNYGIASKGGPPTRNNLSS